MVTGDDESSETENGQAHSKQQICIYLYIVLKEKIKRRQKQNIITRSYMVNCTKHRPGVHIALAKVLHRHNESVEENHDHHQRVEPPPVHYLGAPRPQPVGRGRLAFHRPQATHDELGLRPGALLVRH